MPTTALRPADVWTVPSGGREPRDPGPRGRRPSAVGAVARFLVRCLTVLVGLATAAITLGPRSVVVDGMSTADTWLAAHPTQARLVELLGGVEPAGNLLLFVPFAALLALSVRFRLLPLAFAALVCLPFAVEWLQTFLPGRVPDGNDVVRNTTGLLVGFAVVALLRVLARIIGRVVRAIAG